MRNSRRILALLLSAALVSVAAAGMQHSHSSSDDFVWVDDGHMLSMHSNATSGLVVDRTDPTPFHGLRGGDTILSVDGHRIAHVDDFMQAMRGHGKSPATVRVRRAVSEVALSLTPADCQALVPPPPPPPPAPPPPPPPPNN